MPVRRPLQLTIGIEKGLVAHHDVGRIVIASVTVIILGLQIISASFFLSVLGLKRRRAVGPTGDVNSRGGIVLRD
jgi:hypothetical protein